MPVSNRFGVGCCCGYTPPPPPPDTVPCHGCNVPTSLTLTWYWCGSNQDPCITGLRGLSVIYGPRTDTITYDVTIGRWRSPWSRSPCWGGNGGQVGTPFGCLFHRFTWDCTTLNMAIDFSGPTAGANINTCGVLGFPVGQGTADILSARVCTPFFAMFPSLGAPGDRCNDIGTPQMFAGGVLTP